jgi:cytochrome b6-f complex iron-sulfur subunit
MSNSPAERVGRFVEDLLRGRRLRRFVASDAEQKAMLVAAGLAAGRVGADLPSKEALDRIHQELAQRMDDSAILEPRFNRRVWLRTLGAAAAAVVTGVVIDQVVGGSGVQVGGTTSAPVLMPDGGQWRPVAALSDLPEGHAQAVSSGAIEAVIVNDRGNIHAVSGICTHLGCRLQPDNTIRKLDCPCHQTAFAWSGKVLYYRLQHAPADLPRIQSRVKDGQIELYVV